MFINGTSLHQKLIMKTLSLQVDRLLTYIAVFVLGLFFISHLLYYCTL